MSANKGEINAYREDQIQRAIALFVENDDMSTRKAAMLYGVFTFSCNSRYNGRTTRSESHSDQQLLSELEEIALERWAK